MKTISPECSQTRYSGQHLFWPGAVLNMRERPLIALVFGTRPEAIKLAPVISRLRQHAEEFETLLISTAQHRSMLDQVMEIFGFRPDIDLDLMTHNQTLSGIT